MGGTDTENERSFSSVHRLAGQGDSRPWVAQIKGWEVVGGRGLLWGECQRDSHFLTQHQHDFYLCFVV